MPLLSIAENIFLGNEQSPVRRDRLESRRCAAPRELLRKVGLKEDPDTLITNIGVGKQQLVEIAKALAKKVKLLILDEPTASLSEKDSDALLDLLLEFREQGIASILISHKLNEVGKVADRITVLRDGRTIETLEKADISEDRIITLDGRPLARRPLSAAPSQDRRGRLRGERLGRASPASTPIAQVIKNVNVNVRRGEVVGIAGLMGSGRTEFAMSVFGRAWGTEHLRRGVRCTASRSTSRRSARAVEHGIAYATEDRKTYGLNLIDHIKHNVTVANLKGVSSAGVIDDMRELNVANDYRKQTNIRSSSVYQVTRQPVGRQPAEGGAVEVAVRQPRGADPRRADARHRRRRQIRDLHDHQPAGRRRARRILMISSEMPELLGVCDRIYVMNEGRIVGELPAAEASQEKIMRMIVRGDEADEEHEHR